MPRLTVHVVSPEREIFSGEAGLVVAKGVTGDVGVMADHAPMLIELSVHALRVVEELGGSRETVVIVDGGFLHVSHGEEETRVDVLAGRAELAAEVDASAARARADELRRRAEAGEDGDVERELARALVRSEHGGR